MAYNFTAEWCKSSKNSAPDAPSHLTAEVDVYNNQESPLQRYGHTPASTQGTHGWTTLTK